MILATSARTAPSPRRRGSISGKRGGRVTATVGAWAELVPAPLSAERAALSSAPRPLTEAGAGHIPFAESDRQPRHLPACRATAVVVPEDLPTNGRTVIRVADP